MNDATPDPRIDDKIRWFDQKIRSFEDNGFTDAEARHLARSIRFWLAIAEHSASALRHGEDALTLEPELDLAVREELLTLFVERDDTARAPTTVMLADTLSRHAPPPRALTPFTREAHAA